MTQDSSKSAPLRMCTSCGSMHEGDEHFCAKCGAPLTQHANSDYILGIQSRGFALHKATHSPKKFIVVLGTWLWVGPSFAGCLVLLVSGLATFFQDSGIGARIMTVAGAAGVWLFGTILYRTTKAWLEQRSGAHRTANDGQIDENKEFESEPDDLQDCLDCRKPFAASLPRCPACGWSYRVGTPGDEEAKGLT